MSEYIFPPPATLPAGSAVIAYLRDSGGTNQEQSIGQQERVLTDYCKQYGLALVRIYADTASGRKTKNRDQFLEMHNFMMTCADELRPRGLILWAYSRFSRDIVDFNYYLYGLLKKNIVVHSVTEQIPEGIAGQIMLSVKAYTNADYSIQLGKHIKRGINDMVKAGYSNGGQAPKGYLAVRDHKGTRRNGQERSGVKWVRDPDLAPLVLLAWELRAQGESYTEIIKATGERVYTNRGSWISHFRNKSYLGIGKAGDLEIPDHHEALITWELWDAVRKVEKERDALFYFKRVKNPSLLSGLSFCIHCGAAMILHTSRGYRCYVCGKRDRRRGFTDCPESHRVNANKAERLVLDTVLNRILSNEFINDFVADIQSQLADTNSIDREIGAENNLLISTERSITRLLQLAEETGEMQEIASRLIEFKRKKTESESRIRALRTRRDAVTLQIAPETMRFIFNELRAQIESNIKSGDIATAKKIISSFVQKIELGNKDVIIYYTYPTGITAAIDGSLSAHKVK